MRGGAVVPAAGRASRLGHVDKTMMRLGGQPVLAWVLRTLLEVRTISEIVIATSERNAGPVEELVATLPCDRSVTVVEGGETRKASVEAGLRALSPACELVVIHDAARPLASAALFERVIRAGAADGAAVPGVAVSDTIKRVDGDRVRETLDREGLIAVQTPQVFWRAWLMDAYHRCSVDISATDEASLLEAAGYPVRIVTGEYENLKVTTSVDAIVADALLGTRKEQH